MLKKGLAVLAALLWLLPLSVGATPRSAVLYEPQSGRVLYERDADTARPMASTTKLMTALVTLDVLPPDASVSVPSAALLTEGSSMGLRAGDILTVRDLLAGMLLTSGNDAANAAALLCSGSYAAFAERMNQKARALGMTHTRFVTPSGLDEGDHSASARDMALLGAAVLDVPLLAEICRAKQLTVTVSGRRVTLSNHNRLLNLYPDAVGLKTGFTKKAGRCLVSAATRDGVTLIAVTLDDGDDWNDHIALYEYGFSQTESVTLPTPDLPSLAVAGGTETAVRLYTDPPPAVTLLRSEAASVTCRVELPPFVWASLTAGDCVGQAVYECDGREVYRLPVRAGTSVAATPPSGFWKNWLRRLIGLLRAL